MLSPTLPLQRCYKPISSRDSHRHKRQKRCRRCPARASQRSVRAAPNLPPVDYTEIDAQPLNKTIMALFRRKMVAAIGEDSKLQGYAVVSCPGKNSCGQSGQLQQLVKCASPLACHSYRYDAIIDLTRKLNAMHKTPRDTQIATRGILLSLFPAWLPPAFKLMFSGPMPELSCRLNAWVTALTCQWLMGPCEVNDVTFEDSKVEKAMGVKVARCRYLEESGCAAVCINSCKIPTQEFFSEHMGLQLTMTPNYDDYSCQFDFNKAPPAYGIEDAFHTPCLSVCPSQANAAECPSVPQYDVVPALQSDQ